MTRGLVVSVDCGLVCVSPSLRCEYSFGLGPHSERNSRDSLLAPTANTRLLVLVSPNACPCIPQGCSTDFYVLYDLPQQGLTLSSRNPLVVASSTRPNRPKSSLPPAQSRPLALRQARPVATLNSNSNNDKGLRPYLMTPQHPRLAPPPNCPSRRSPSLRSHPPPQRWRLIHR